jgi:hypothetical protein
MYSATISSSIIDMLFRGNNMFAPENYWPCKVWPMS